MEENRTIWIQVDAAKALAEWKAFFAEQVAIEARELAKNSSPSDLVTLDHYRQAAKSAARKLLIFVQDIDSSDGHREAA